jgi:phosphatidate cytidylyltransferase
MLRKRTLVVLVFLPIGVLAIYTGGWFFTLTVIVLGGISAWEYSQLMRASGLQPSLHLVVGGTLLLYLQRQLDGLGSGHAFVSALILLSAGYHLFDYDRGRQQAAIDFSVTLAGILYFGWVGAYMISLRNLPEGFWWTFIVLPSIWLADICAYVVGTRWGKRKLSLLLSPKKTWEGFWGGVGGGLICAAVLGFIFPLLGGKIPAWSGLILGLFVGIIATMGDLTASLFKRQAGAKDSSNLVPGHGGVLDRIDSWLWMGVVSYYLIAWLWV